MNKQEKEVHADWEYWKRVATLLGVDLHGWSYRHSASFFNPHIEVAGLVAEKLIEQENEIERLKGELAAERFNHA